MRVERERDCDPECAGGIGLADEWAGADILIYFGTIFAGDSERRHWWRFGNSRRKSKYFAAKWYAVLE
jgi:hypothetical protein